MDGVTVIFCSVTVVTVTEPVPVIAPNVAVILEVPAASPDTMPVEDMPATVGDVDAQVAVDVTSTVVPPPYVAIALYCAAPSIGMLCFAEDTAMDCNTAVAGRPPLLPPQPESWNRNTAKSANMEIALASGL